MQPTPSTGSAGAAPSWGDQTGFIQRSQPAFWLFCITMALTGLVFLGEELNLIAMGASAWVTTIIMLIPYAIPVVAIIYYLDLYEREPRSIMIAALLWGGVAAVVLSMYTNTPLSEIIYKVTGDSGFTQDWGAALTAPFVEEGFKLLGVVLLISIARNELDDELDGFVWGAMVGMGFLLIEDTFYFVRSFADSGSFGSLFQMFLIRILGAGPYSHFLYTGLTGMGVAYYLTRTDKPSGNRLMVMVLLIVAGVGAHFLWNSPLLGGLATNIFGFYLMVTIKGLPMLVGLIILIRLARRRERAWFATFSQTFHDDGAITPADLAELSGIRARRRARKAAGRAKGPQAEKLKGKLQGAQIHLGMLMGKFGDEAAPEVAAQQSLVMGLKAQLDALPSMGMPMAAAGAAAGGWGAAPAAQAPVQSAQAAWGQPTQPTQPAQPAAQQAWQQQPQAQPQAQQPAQAAWGQPAQPQPAQPQPAQQAWQPQPQAQPQQPAQATWGQPAPTPTPEPVQAQPVQQPVEPAPQPVVQPVAQPQPVQPAPQPAPVAPPPVAPVAPAWTPTHRVPAGGIPAWAAPDPSQAPVANLAAGLDLVVAETRGDWARVVAVNTWSGWVDKRRLVPTA